MAKSIDDICRAIVRRKHPYNPYCPYGRKPEFDDLWEDAKERMREDVRTALESARS